MAHKKTVHCRVARAHPRAGGAQKPDKEKKTQGQAKQVANHKSKVAHRKQRSHVRSQKNRQHLKNKRDSGDSGVKTCQAPQVDKSKQLPTPGRIR